MPIRYERDDRRKRAVITITGPFDPSEVFGCLEQHRAGGAWTYGLLYDLRYMTGEPTMETLREFASTIAPRPGEPPRGRGVPNLCRQDEPRRSTKAVTPT